MHKLMVAPMREYIEQWLKNALFRITDPESQGAITTIRVPPTRHHIKKILVSNQRRFFPT